MSKASNEGLTKGIGRRELLGSAAAAAATTIAIPALAQQGRDFSRGAAPIRYPEGDVVSLDGMLVEADKANGWRWRSSLTRDDTGNGACELVYVQSLTVQPR